MLCRMSSAAIAGIACTLMARGAAAQTDEIQVYNGGINEVGQASLTLHNNYTPIGRKEPEFPGGIVPQGALNGVAEWAYGAKDWLELGLYLPLYSVTREGRPLINGGKVRVLFAEPHVADRQFFYAINFEFSYNALHWEPTRYSSEIRPIVGVRFGPVDLIFNPIFDNSWTGVGSLDFAPAARLDYNVSPAWAVALEHYADYGQVRDFVGLKNEQQMLFAVVDYSGAPADVEAGIGHGFTAGSDGLVLKLMLTRNF
ncbi:MAG TPA: hypothetical protein VGL83_08270 [Stellaceae bacterium]|jgi:hypothetical protein